MLYSARIPRAAHCENLLVKFKKSFWPNGTKRRNTNSIEGLVEKQFSGKTRVGGG